MGPRKVRILRRAISPNERRARETGAACRGAKEKEVEKKGFWKKEEPSYSAEERRAYHIGVGASLGAGQNTKLVKKMAAGMKEKERKSFWNGFDDGLTTQAWRHGGKIIPREKKK